VQEFREQHPHDLLHQIQALRLPQSLQRKNLPTKPEKKTAGTKVSRITAQKDKQSTKLLNCTSTGRRCLGTRYSPDRRKCRMSHKQGLRSERTCVQWHCALQVNVEYHASARFARKERRRQSRSRRESVVAGVPHVRWCAQTSNAKRILA
jgi:hypothetical protein